MSDAMQNMVLVAIHAPDENRTQHGLRATLTFERILTAESVLVANAARNRLTAEPRTLDLARVAQPAKRYQVESPF
jgi:hypothetical protein